MQCILQLGDDLRRMTLDGENLDYAQLCTVINELFTLPALDSYRITYIDIVCKPRLCVWVYRSISRVERAHSGS